MPSHLLRRPKLRVSPFPQRDGTIRLGWDPEASFIVAGPPEVGSDVVLAVLRSLDGCSARAHIIWLAGTLGMSASSASTLLAELDEAGLLVDGRGPNAKIPDEDRPRSAIVHLLGRGPLADAIRAGATASSKLDLRHSCDPPLELLRHEEGRWTCDLAILTDDLVPDPRVVTALVLTKTPHLQVRLRDGKGVVGPMVIPGASSCLRCLELVRCGMDPQWPHVSAQLLGRVGDASKPTVLAAAALVLEKIDAFVGQRSTSLTDSTVEIDLPHARMATRTWKRHPLCDCASV